MSASSGSPRFPSYGSSTGRAAGAAEQGQTMFLERQNSQHRNLHRLGSTASSSEAAPLLRRPFPRTSSVGGNSNGNNNNSGIANMTTVAEGRPSRLVDLPLSLRTSTGSSSSRGHNHNHYNNTIRFQVVIWNIGKLDVVSGQVPMTFRVSLFWNDDAIALAPVSSFGELLEGGDALSGDEHENDNDNDDDDASSLNTGTVTSSSVHVWKMHGRQRAFQQELKDVPSTKAIAVPPLAILNVATFETIGAPDIDMLSAESRLMRWTCMYRATVIQDSLRVSQFPHDDHDICLKLGILSHRGKGAAFDRRYWKLDLATESDAMSSTRVPHGLVVDQARIPGFAYNKERGLQFDFCALEFGNNASDELASAESSDTYLKVHLNILRESGYYDMNIVPLVALLNVVAVSVLTFEDTEFFYRGLITLNIAFVEMSIRMTADSHLPSVGYEIRLQRILNEFFVVLMMLVLEAMVVYVLGTYYHVDPGVTKVIDWMMGIFAVAHNAFTLVRYYKSKREARYRLMHGWKRKLTKTV